MAKKDVIIPANLNIKVTAKDIKAGIPDDGKKCPIWRALIRQGFGCIGVSWNFIKIEFTLPDGNGLRMLYKIPPIAERFVEAFDGGELVKPFSFTAKA